MGNRQAVLIMAHDNLWSLKELIKSLDSTYFDIFVHIDLKSKIKRENVSNLCRFSRLFVYKNFDISWGHYSQVNCELFLLKNALSEGEYSYFHLISGVDLPIKSNKEIYSFFENSQKEFIHFESEKLPSDKESYYRNYNFNMENYKKSFFYKFINKVGLLMQHILLIKINQEVEFCTGANWFSITRECASFIVSREDSIYKIYKYTRSPDESFVQTIVYNSKFKNRLYNNNFDDNYDACKRLIDWKRGNPYIFRISDYESIISSPCFFARKFDERVDKKIIEKIVKSR